MPADIRERIQFKNFGRIEKVLEIPNLVEIQRESFRKFLQADLDHAKRENIGLQGVFHSVFPIKDFNDTASLEFISYHLGQPKYDVAECRQRGMTFAALVRVVVRLVVWDVDPDTAAQSIRDVKEQEVYFGEIPLMTEHGTFIINGTERVVVSQLHRSPGIFFEHDKGKTHASGKLLYSARVIPYRGSWLDFEFDPKDILHVRIDRRRKFPATILLKALGASTNDILQFYYHTETYTAEGKKYSKNVVPEVLKYQRAQHDIKDPKNKTVLVKAGRKFTRPVMAKIAESKLDKILVETEEMIDRLVATDLHDIHPMLTERGPNWRRGIGLPPRALEFYLCHHFFLPWRHDLIFLQLNEIEFYRS